MSRKKKILFIVEGEETEPSFIGSVGHRLLALHKDEYEVFPYKTSIYELYDAYKNDEYDYIVDYLVFEKGLSIPDNLTPKEVFTAIYLVFDYDYKYQKYSDDVIRYIIKLFNNETENGKLYINYPMFESCFHLKNIPDYEFIERKIDTNECNSENYKRLVRKETCIKTYKRIDRKKIFNIIKYNYEKALVICGIKKSDYIDIDYEHILEEQIKLKNEDYCIYVLNTFVLFIIDYNPDLLKVIENAIE